MLLSLLMWAEEEAQQPNPLLNPLTIMLGLFLLFWLFVLRPSMKRQEAERQTLLGGLEKNDQILTIGGIYATVVSVSEKEDEMIVRVEDNVKMKMTRSSVARNLSKEERMREAAAQVLANQQAAKEQAK